MKLTKLQQTLIDNGYIKHEQSEDYLCHSTNILFQKGISDDCGIKYFIDIYYYPAHTYGNTTIQENMQVETQFHYKDEEILNVVLSNTNIIECENKLNDIWTKLELEYYCV